MKRSTDRILTTHTGSLPRPPEILETMRLKEAGKPYDDKAYEEALSRNVADIVRRQAQAGIDVVNDGECSKPSFTAYLSERLGGFEPRIPPGGVPAAGPIDPNGRDAVLFPDYYKLVMENSPFANVVRVLPRVCTGPIRYLGHKPLARDIANLKLALSDLQVEEAFLPAAGPVPALANEFYASDEQYQAAFADAMREEYKAILDAGLLLQIDYPRLVSSWDSRKGVSLTEYRKWAEGRVEVVNHALRDLPEERIRFHTCYGVNFGPRVSDLQLADIIDIIFRIKAGSYSFEAANPRHDHEWRVPQKIKIPEGKIIIPGVVTHSNVMIEHPELVADRIERWARSAGRENILVGNDCGFQSTAGNTEIPMSIAWAKLQALGEGARIASRRLWS